MARRITSESKFEIIKNSEGCKKWNIPDNEYRGQINGLACGWEFEVEKDGKLDSLSVIYEEGTPERTAKRNYLFEPDTIYSLNGYHLTGRVVFRGYGELYWYEEERDWCVHELTDAQVEELIKQRN